MPSQDRISRLDFEYFRGLWQLNSVGIIILFPKTDKRIDRVEVILETRQFFAGPKKYPIIKEDLFLWSGNYSGKD